MLGKADATTASATGLSLEAQGVKASYGAVSVFQGVSRTIAAGEFVAPLGFRLRQYKLATRHVRLR